MDSETINSVEKGLERAKFLRKKFDLESLEGVFEVEKREEQFRDGCPKSIELRKFSGSFMEAHEAVVESRGAPIFVSEFTNASGEKSRQVFGETAWSEVDVKIKNGFYQFDFSPYYEFILTENFISFKKWNTEFDGNGFYRKLLEAECKYKKM